VITCRCVRPTLVAVLCALAALAGAGGVLFAGETGGWLNGAGETVLVREPLVRGSVPAQVVVSKPVLARGFAPRRIFAERSPGVVTVLSSFGGARARTSDEGSGFVVSRSGVILTAAHVIASAPSLGKVDRGFGKVDRGSGKITPASAVYVEFSDHERVRAQIVGWDPYDDVGVLRVSPSSHRLDPVPLGSSSSLAVGDPVAAIGSPFGFPTSLSIGIVSGTDRTIPTLVPSYSVFDAIQTDAPVNEGNSGGPLLDARGRAIGINSQLRSNAPAFDGVGFAVPIDSARRSLGELLATGHVSYAYLGLETENLTPSIARAYGYAAGRGALVDAVRKGGPADRAGIRPGRRVVSFAGRELTIGGDAIVAIDGTAVANSDDVARFVSDRLSPGESAQFTVVRGRERITLPVELTARPS
jgi:S1-C subfamily serine protease